MLDPFEAVMLSGIVVIWAVLIICVGKMAQSRGRSVGGWFLFALFLSPLLAVIVLAVLPAMDARPRQKCPHCAEMILADAVLCRYCHGNVQPVVQTLVAAGPVAPVKGGSLVRVLVVLGVVAIVGGGVAIYNEFSVTDAALKERIDAAESACRLGDQVEYASRYREAYKAIQYASPTNGDVGFTALDSRVRKAGCEPRY